MTTDTPKTHVVLNIAEKVHHRRICIKFSDTCNVNGSTEQLGDHMWCQMRLYMLRLSESLKMPIRGFKWILWGFYSTNRIRSGNNRLPKTTSWRRNTSYDVQVVKSSLPVQARRGTKYKRKKNQNMICDVFAETTHVQSINQ